MLLITQLLLGSASDKYRAAAIQDRDLEEPLVSSTGQKPFNIYFQRRQLNQPLEKPSTTFSMFNRTTMKQRQYTLHF